MLPQEGAERIETSRVDGFLYCLHIANYIESYILNPRHNGNADLVIADRGLFNFATWVVYLHNLGEIDNETLKKTIDFYTMPKILNLIDQYNVLVCSPKVALEREDVFSITANRSPTVNEESLKRLLEAHKQTKKIYNEKAIHISWIDTDQKSLRELGITLVHSILDDIVSKVGLNLED